MARSPAAPVPPVEKDGVRYRASVTGVQAETLASGQLLWGLELGYVNDLFFEGDRLVVSDERDIFYSLDAIQGRVLSSAPLPVSRVGRMPPALCQPWWDTLRRLHPSLQRYGLWWSAHLFDTPSDGGQSLTALVSADDRVGLLHTMDQLLDLLDQLREHDFVWQRMERRGQAYRQQLAAGEALGPWLLALSALSRKPSLGRGPPGSGGYHHMSPGRPQSPIRSQLKKGPRHSG